MPGFEDILNMLARGSAKTPTPSASDGYQYFWGDHPEKNKTAMARYERFGGQADPLGGEVGREASGYMQPTPNMFTAGGPGDAINRLPIKMRQKYLALLGRMHANFDQGSQQ
jgi:hypothetical protein